MGATTDPNKDNSVMDKLTDAVSRTSLGEKVPFLDKDGKELFREVVPSPTQIFNIHGKRFTLKNDKNKRIYYQEF